MPKKLDALEIKILLAISLHTPVSITEVKRIYFICKSFDMVIKSIEYGFKYNMSVSYYAEHNGVV